jgi:hypothetical protein
MSTAAMTTSPSPAAEAPAALLYKQVLDAVQQCQSIEDFVFVYESAPFQTIMARMRRSCHEAMVKHNQTIEQWAHDWAVRMRGALDGPDVDLNLYRKAGLVLLYELCNAWMVDKDNTSVTAESIVAKFQGHRVENILLLALPLDRAQCLYAMMYPSSTNHEYGMHWVSSEHYTSNEQTEDWEDLVRLHDGRSTMNKRLVWLSSLTGLEFGSSDIARWLEPTRCPCFVN